MQGFVVEFKTDCPHVNKCVKRVPGSGIDVETPCGSCGDTRENWVCLTCYTTLCSRYVNGHMAAHIEEQKSSEHCTAASFSDLSVWCFQCEHYITDRCLQPPLDALKKSKFEEQSKQPAVAFSFANPEQQGFQGEVSAEVLSALQNDLMDILKECELSKKIKCELRYISRGQFELVITGELDSDDTKFLKKISSYKRKHNLQISKVNKELIEYFDNEETLNAKCTQLANMIMKSKHFVAHTGAGISTSCKIPDYRGPDGAWTRRDQGLLPVGSIPLADADPSFAHKSLVKLMNNGLLKYLMSQNSDGLHLRSGIDEEKMSELHGNAFKEKCSKCDKTYLRDFDTHKTVNMDAKDDPKSKSGISHWTGRKCDDCGGRLRDSIIHFSETLPVKELSRAEDNCKRADVQLCLGTSLRVTPAADLPFYHGKVVIVNLQKTGKEEAAKRSGGFIIHARIDDVMTRVMSQIFMEDE